jgi:hypothetical protein
MKSNQTIEVPLVTYNELLEIERKYLLLKKVNDHPDCDFGCVYHCTEGITIQKKKNVIP